MSPRTGRPTDNPKSNPIHVRLDDESKTILEKYCEQEKIPRSEMKKQSVEPPTKQNNTLQKYEENPL